ncbi:outer membrane beta-barrel protein [Pseudomonas sp. MAP12]|uniref:Outer membrane beta-barrel protein n=1 Tax=Geopseudomonas aromaticivorans TaxID=2849492 RepID=A0ABS6MUH7_9GAMM|nr:OmpW family outer membrane protein [Pseudomonas aromaticivorans]MBV2132210.1 outer membrane beta-barrel protein [Pseudomonas aromaticivorans]
MSLNWLSHATLGALLLAGSATAQAGDSPWQARIGVSKIVPTSDSGSILPGEVDIDSSTGPTVNLAYFFTPNLAIDVLGGLPFKHDIKLNGSKIGSTKQLPPIVSLQYHFAPQARLRPFVGVGLNYTYFFDEKLDNGADLELSDSWGAAFQAGLDVAIDDNWTVGGDVRYAKIDSTVKVNGVTVGSVDVDPTVYSVNLGYRF